LEAPNVYDGRALNAFVEQEMPRWWALLEHLYEARDPRWLTLVEQERRFWETIIALEQQLRRLTATVWSIVAMLQADDPMHQALGTRLLADLVRPPLLSVAEWEELCDRASTARMRARTYLQQVVMPEALLLVLASLHVPRRIQLGAHGHGRILDAEGHWTPQAPIMRLTFMMLSFFIVQQVTEAARSILADTTYPKTRSDAYVGSHGIRSLGRTRVMGPPVSLFRELQGGNGNKAIYLLDQVPVSQATPEALVIRQQEKERQVAAIERLKQLASDQQRDILYGLALGLTPAQIARALGLRRQAVNTQIRRLREKSASESEHVFDFL
jgi:DNA-binding CsgD family transcriptional regulator